MLAQTGHRAHTKKTNIVLSDIYASIRMTNPTELFNIYSSEPSAPEPSNDNGGFSETTRANASKLKNILLRDSSYHHYYRWVCICLGVNQDFSKDFVRITIKIPQLKTKINMARLKRIPKNGLTKIATYNGK